MTINVLPESTLSRKECKIPGGFHVVGGRWWGVLSDNLHGVTVGHRRDVGQGLVAIKHIEEAGLKKPYMMAAAALALYGVAFVSPASARIVCNGDPVCQAKRDGTDVATARKRQSALTSCLAAVGHTEQDWRAYKVPAPLGDRVRECMWRKVRLRV